MILSTSATDPRRTAFVYLIAAAGTAFFGAVYECFSHGVWSPWMVYAFAFPLILGAVPAAWRALRAIQLPRPGYARLYNAGIAALTVGSILQGVLDIYGTTNQLITVYWIAGILLILFSFILRLFHR